MNNIQISLKNLRLFIEKMEESLDSGQPACSAFEGGDYYVEDAIKDLTDVEIHYLAER